MAKIKFKTKGMHCQSCEMLVTDELNDIDGVNSSKADNKTGIIEVEYDEKKVKPEHLKYTIEAEGYEVQ